MKAKVMIPFTDKTNGKQYKKGDIIDVTATRFNEIAEKGKYLQAYDENEKPVKA